MTNCRNTSESVLFCFFYLGVDLGTDRFGASLGALPAMWETWVWSLGREDPLEKEMAPHSSTLAWRIPWMEEPGGLQSTGSQRVGHDWATSLSLSVPKNIQISKDLSHQISWNRVCQSTLNSLRGCWRSTAIATWDLVSLEADSKCLCCSVFDNALGRCQFVVDIYLQCLYI